MIIAKAEETSYEVEVKEISQPETQLQQIAPTSPSAIAAVTSLINQADTTAFIAKVS